MSELSLRTWRFGRRLVDGEERAYDLLNAYADAGGNFIDTADKYGDGRAERWIGNWLEDRDRADYVDLLYCHRWDDGTPAEEFMRTLDGLVDSGKVNYLGISSGKPDASKIVKADEIARSEGNEPFTVTQPRYSLVDRAVDASYLPMCRDYGLGAVT